MTDKSSNKTLEEALAINQNTQSITALISNVSQEIQNINNQVLKSKNY